MNLLFYHQSVFYHKLGRGCRVKPVIGITCGWKEAEQRYQLCNCYVRSIERAGGIPVLLSYVEQNSIGQLADLCDGLLFSGGGDLDPVYWGAQATPETGEIVPERDLFEIGLARYAFSSRKPVLGICRGCQLLNTAAGGSLIQHVESHICHEQNAPRHYSIHDIVLKEGSLLHQIVKNATLRVNSFHHQAVGDLASGLQVCAWAADGIVEGIESKAHPFWLGVQWHPESMRDESSKSLFRALIKAAMVAKPGNGRVVY